MICEALKKNLVVNTIKFNNCKRDEIYLQEMLSKNSTVRKLDLSNNTITYDGLNKLADGLCENTTLQVLNLSCNHLGSNSDCMHVVQILMVWLNAGNK